MKKIFEEAAELFRRNDFRPDKDGIGGEMANLCRGLALLAEGLHKLEQKLSEAEAQNGSAVNSPLRPLRRSGRTRIIVATPNPSKS